jgi:aryl-alcohol dehydrogenase-like predicted oxidoreductase
LSSARTTCVAAHTALEAGITLLDTGDFYGMGHNELLINEALRVLEPCV